MKARESKPFIENSGGRRRQICVFLEIHFLVNENHINKSTKKCRKK